MNSTTETVVLAALSLFVRHGYKRTSIDDIAEKAHLAKRTLYLHFENKAEIFRQTGIFLIERCEAHIREALRLQEATLQEQLTTLLYAKEGTLFEFVGDSDFLDELGIVASSLLDERLLELDRFFAEILNKLLKRWSRAGLIGKTPRGLTWDDICRIIIRSAVAAKHDRQVRGNPEAYREQLSQIAALIIAATATR